MTAAEKSFWAFQPVKNPAPPAVKNQNWIRTPVDQFVLAKLEEKDLDPSPPAVGESTIMGIDATRPFGKDFPDVAEVPGAEDFVIPGWNPAGGS